MRQILFSCNNWRSVQRHNYTTGSTTSKINRLLNVCVFGSHRSGKTVLCSALTKYLSKINSTRFLPIDILDSSPEEKETNSTVNLSFAPIKCEKTKVVLLDCPGRYDLTRFKILGINLSDYGILVVPASETSASIISQQIKLAKHFNLIDIAVFLSKSDMTQSKHLDLDSNSKETQIKRILNDHGYSGDTIISGSALKHLNDSPTKDNCLQQIIDYIDSAQTPFRDLKSPLLLKIVSRNILGKNDAYIVGYIESGTIQVGKKVQILGKNRDFEVTISKVLSALSDINNVKAGSFCELMLRGSNCSWMAEGMVAVEPDTYEAYDNIECNIFPYLSGTNVKKELEGFNELLHLYSDQSPSRCKYENLDLCANSKDVFNCKLQLGSSLILKKDYPFALAKGRSILGLGNVKLIHPNLSEEEKIGMHRAFPNKML